MYTDVNDGRACGDHDYNRVCVEGLSGRAGKTQALSEAGPELRP